MYVCHQCNDAKGDHFPHRIGGYISPADPDCAGYFEYNFTTHEICVNRQFMDARIKERIERTIKDLDLNSIELLNARAKKKKEIDDELAKIDRQRFSLNVEKQRKRNKIRQYTKATLPLSSFVAAYGVEIGILA